LKRLLLLLFLLPAVQAQHSVARQWNDVLLDAIRNDFARPTVHARNLFHCSVAMYDAWAVYDDVADTYLLGKSVDGFNTPFSGIETPVDRQAAQETAISYAAFRLLSHRFANSPGKTSSALAFSTLLAELGHDGSATSTDYSSGSAAALGNYIAAQLIAFGAQDGANEDADYANEFYSPVNDPLATALPGAQSLDDPNRWQPLTFDFFIDQANNLIPLDTPLFLSPEWGTVSPFALQAQDLTIHSRDGDDYWAYHDPGAPPYVELTGGGDTDEYRWNFELVSIWSSHLDPSDDTMWDISPASIGNVQSYPTTISGLRSFYNLIDGGDTGIGHTVNPSTGSPYPAQLVKRADYARVLAEFWADGPDSETPPGHWFTILNYVNDHADFVKRFEGKGPILDELAWDVKAYFLMGGTVHDAAVTAWGVKGWYDYIRPISALRGLAQRGQHGDQFAPRYHPAGISIVDGYIEQIESGDPLAGVIDQHVGKIKIKAWRGPDYIADPDTDVAGVGWIMAENWWPYQRPTFVTPPFAGYVSGHSTFSRAAAEVMTALTGDAFFPGGMGEFVAAQNSFLVFEEGPSADVTLQWATYRDASDQCSLSRIWGGIHPPADDIPGRLMGLEIGLDSFRFGRRYFTGKLPPTEAVDDAYIFPRNSRLEVAAGTGVLGNDNGHNGQTIQAVAINNLATTLGQVSLASDGAFTYVPIGDYLGQDSFEYQIQDEWGDTSVATVALHSTGNSDVDGDGLPDDWELLYSGTLAGMSPNGDEDGDEIPNILEFRTGLLPNNPEPDALLVLQPGWNLVSIPSSLPSPSINSVFEDRVTACWRWDAANRRFVSAPRDARLSDKTGYWVFSPRLDFIDLRP
jgi:hypothetical protein